MDLALYPRNRGGKEDDMGARTVSTRQARDPVCGCEIAAGEAHFAAQLDGRPYAFCTEACRDRFLRDPGRYV
ncbi:MAG: YHS domain-containing protein, partial [Deltaproteobacteria bacterium]|nr:YHS domain-containing protein [Deltaproteobacteria bacterium]